MQITEEKENKLLHRKELAFRVEAQKATPSVLSVKTQIAKQAGVDENRVVVAGIDHRFGEKNATGIARIYERPEDLARIELAHVKKKNTPPKKEEKAEEKAAAQESPAKAEAEEAPKGEDPKEETKKE